jgi:hypothetical protein
VGIEENLGQVAACARGEIKLLMLIVAIGVAKAAFVVLTWRVKVDNLFQGQRSAGGCLGCCHDLVVVGSSSGGTGVVWESSSSRVVECSCGINVGPKLGFARVQVLAQKF